MEINREMVKRKKLRRNQAQHARRILEWKRAKQTLGQRKNKKTMVKTHQEDVGIKYQSQAEFNRKT